MENRNTHLEMFITVLQEFNVLSDELKSIEVFVIVFIIACCRGNKN